MFRFWNIYMRLRARKHDKQITVTGRIPMKCEFYNLSFFDW